jgi:hypothetical protein
VIQRRLAMITVAKGCDGRGGREAFTADPELYLCSIPHPGSQVARGVAQAPVFSTCTARF